MKQGRVIIACVAFPAIAAVIVFAALNPGNKKKSAFGEYDQAPMGPPSIIKFHDRRHPAVVTYSCAMGELAARNMSAVNNRHQTDLVAESVLLLPGDPEYMRASQTPKEKRICPPGSF